MASGSRAEFDLEKIIDPNFCIAEDCCSIGSSYQTVRYGNIYDNLAKLYKFNVNTPWKNLSEKQKRSFYMGRKKNGRGWRLSTRKKRPAGYEYVQWKGVIAEAQERLIAAKSDVYRKNMAELMIEGHLSLLAMARGSSPIRQRHELGARKSRN